WETAILSWRQPGSFTAAAPSSLIAVMNLSISAGMMSNSTTRMWRGPDCAVACSPRIGNSHAATPSAIARIMIATDFDIGNLLPLQMFGSSARLLLPPWGKLRQLDKHTLIWGYIRAAQRPEADIARPIRSPRRRAKEATVVR